MAPSTSAWRGESFACAAAICYVLFFYAALPVVAQQNDTTTTAASTVNTSTTTASINNTTASQTASTAPSGPTPPPGATLNMSSDCSLTHNRSEVWPYPYSGTQFLAACAQTLGLFPCVVNDTAPTGSSGEWAPYCFSLDIVFQTAIVTINRTTVAASTDPDTWYYSKRLAQLALSSPYLAPFNISKAAPGYSPVEVPQWLRRPSARNDMKFYVIGAIGGALALAQIIFAVPQRFATGKLVSRNHDG